MRHLSSRDITEAAALWRSGADSKAIADILCVAEARVWRALDTIRKQARRPAHV